MEENNKENIDILTILEKIMYPNVCGVCEKICENYICDECEKLLKNVIVFHRDRNDKKYGKEKINFFNEHIYFGMYKGILREKILDFKFHNKPYLYKFFSEIIIKFEKEYRFLKKYDIIIPVPIHKKRKIERGYNQTELIAKCIAKEYKNLKFINALKRINYTNFQSKLNKLERSENVKNAFSLNILSDRKSNFFIYSKFFKKIMYNEKVKLEEQLNGKNVILFDDIYTTGATANECCRLLKVIGVHEILLMTIAKD